MHLDDELWTQKWSHTPFDKVVATRVPDVGAVGCDDEPVSSVWCAALAEAIGEHYREGMTLLDYGCGYGRMFNFLTGRLRDFTYYGLEVEGAATGHGERCLRYAIDTFGSDGRAVFGFSDSEVETRAIEESEIVLLGSVFTHMAHERFQSVFSRFDPVLERGGAVVFSVLLGDTYCCTDPGFLLGMDDDFYQDVRYTRDQLEQYCGDRGLALVEAEFFDAPLEDQPMHSTGGDRQTIFRVELSSSTRSSAHLLRRRVPG